MQGVEWSALGCHGLVWVRMAGLGMLEFLKLNIILIYIFNFVIKLTEFKNLQILTLHYQNRVHSRNTQILPSPSYSQSVWKFE
jgi:hypothetical protein